VYLGVALSTSLLPLALILVVRYYQLQQWRLRQTVATPPPLLTLTGDNRDEQITVQRSHLLCLKGADNYVEVFVQKGAAVERHVLRGALTRLAAQLNDPALVQVHRSFVVNVEHPFRLAGQSPNYVLHLTDALEPIPVSRQKLAEVRRLLREKPL
jgi:DNA-binding LytR/AlgR family response regulator